MAQKSVIQKSAFITGVTGQDGTYMTQLLISKGYKVFGLTRELRKTYNYILNPLISKIRLVPIDYGNDKQLNDLISEHKPHEFYNFAAHSTGTGMFSEPLAIGKMNGFFVHQILEAIRLHSPETRFIQASSREIFGQTKPHSQIDETTPRFPMSPYGAAKLYADNMIKVYRDHFKIFASSAILFNHESPLRGLSFVTRKITSTAAQIKLGRASNLELGSLTSMRDWGFAGDYMKAMWMMAQAETPRDYVVATGQSHSVEDFCRFAFRAAGLDHEKYVRVASSLTRAVETPPAQGDSSALRKDLGWAPEISFEKLVEMMVQAELDYGASPLE